MKKTLTFITIFLFFIFSPFFIVKADMGPKPLIRIKIEGIQGNYTAALAADVEFGPNHRYNPDIEYHYMEYHKIMEYEDEEGYFWITKYQKMKEDDTFYFTYYPPSTFKLIIMLEDETLIVSQVHKTYAFESLYTVNVDVEKPSELLVLKEVKNTLGNSINTVIRLVLTLIIEFIILLLFKIKDKRSIIIFVVVNIITQLFLNITLTLFNYYDGRLVALIYYFMIEILIFIIESVAYILLIKNQSKSKLTLYSMIANGVSFFAGLIIFINFLN